MKKLLSFRQLSGTMAVHADALHQCSYMFLSKLWHQALQGFLPPLCFSGCLTWEHMDYLLKCLLPQGRKLSSDTERTGLMYRTQPESFREGWPAQVVVVPIWGCVFNVTL